MEIATWCQQQRQLMLLSRVQSKPRSISLPFFHHLLSLSLPRTFPSLSTSLSLSLINPSPLVFISLHSSFPNGWKIQDYITQRNQNIFLLHLHVVFFPLILRPCSSSHCRHSHSLLGFSLRFSCSFFVAYPLFPSRWIRFSQLFDRYSTYFDHSISCHTM